MSSLRNAYLEVLGIDRWVPRGAEEPEAPVLVEPPRAPQLRVAAPETRTPTAAPTSVAHPPASAYQRGPLAGDWEGLRTQVAGCTACEQLCKARTQTGARLLDVFALPGAHGALLVVLGIEFAEGEPEHYVIPIGFLSGEPTVHLEQRSSHAVIAKRARTTD